MPEDEFSESAARLRARNEDGPMVPAIADRRWRDPMTITPSTEPVRSLLPLSVYSGTDKATVNALAYRTVGKISPTLKNVKLPLHSGADISRNVTFANRTIRSVKLMKLHYRRLAVC